MAAKEIEERSSSQRLLTIWKNPAAQSLKEIWSRREMWLGDYSRRFMFLFTYKKPEAPDCLNEGRQSNTRSSDYIKHQVMEGLLKADLCNWDSLVPEE